MYSAISPTERLVTALISGTSAPPLTLGIYAQATTEGDRTAADLLGELLEADDGQAETDPTKNPPKPTKTHQNPGKPS